MVRAVSVKVCRYVRISPGVNVYRKVTGVPLIAYTPRPVVGVADAATMASNKAAGIYLGALIEAVIPFLTGLLYAISYAAYDWWYNSLITISSSPR